MTFGSNGILAVFTKFWEPGKVKTRLAATVGDHQASELHRAFVAATLDRLGKLEAHRIVAAWPPEKLDEFRDAVDDRWELRPQSTGDLGEKLANFFASSLSLCGETCKAVVVGSDSPDIPLDRVEQAFALLDQHQVVLGPASDGGYYLIGMRKYARLFDGITWSTTNVFAQTVERLRNEGIDYATLAEWHDVDDWTDLQELMSRLSGRCDDSALLSLRSWLTNFIGQVSP